MTKFVRVLIIINGLMLPVILCFLFYQMIKSFLPKEDKYHEEGLIVGEELEQAKCDTLALQGIHYDYPEPIYNSPNYYLPISAMTYKEAKDLRKVMSSAGDLSMSFLQIFNVVFLDSNYQVIRNLLDKKAFISDINIPWGDREKVDRSIQNIAYEIAFEDSNNDGKLNNYDNMDLYISDLDGGNLLQVTKNIDVKSYEFINYHKDLLIRYKERNDEREEHKKVKFAFYNITTSSFKSLSELNNHLDELEKQLIN
ncbi:hypothetical protein [Chondrinema litorale]|uniref:hypothetical protein n=1 Tax=Chondrinema litorale TaxID=2994555 RepID=UPI002543A43D|nr:hypothetical protein [Chondrinema litorale]UZR95680.1 hypothetical protein OQ292_07635 [Chondrinema litorale]